MRFALPLSLALIAGCPEPEPAAPPAVEPAPERTARKTPARQPAERPPAPPSAVGMAVADLEVHDWLTSETTADAGDVTLVVFWEVWCPHCRKEVPRLQEWHSTYADDGLNLVSLTRLTRGKSRDEAASFLESNEVTYPSGVGGYDLAKRLGVRGIPSAVVIQDGTVVWQGHPGRLRAAQLEDWLAM